MTKIAADNSISFGRANRLAKLRDNPLGDRAVVERVDFQHPVSVRNEGVLVRRRSRLVDDGVTNDVRRRQLLDDKFSELVVAQHRGKDDIGSGFPDMARDDSRAADIVLTVLISYAECRGLCVAANKRTMGVCVDDCIPKHMNSLALKIVERLTEVVEPDILGLHHNGKFLAGDARG